MWVRGSLRNNTLHCENFADGKGRIAIRVMREICEDAM